MRFLLDTCVLSDFAQGRPDVLARVKATPPAEIAVSTITEMEIAYGLLLNARLARLLRPVVDAFLSAVHVLPYDAAAALETASLRAALRRRGRQIGAYDALIAGSALAQGLTLVTSNIREFERVERLTVEDWRS